MSIYTHAARKIGMTAAEQFWYILGCIAFGAAYLRKVPVKKALADYGLVEMTAAEKSWYILGCVCFGAAYLSKVPVAKALSELEQSRVARPAPHDQLQSHDPRLSGPDQVHESLPEQGKQQSQA